MSGSRIAVCVLLGPLFLCADQITLKNGDRVSGKIVKKDGGKLTVKSDLMGDVTVEWSAVTSITSDEPLTVVLPGDKTVEGKLTTANSNLEVAPAAGQAASAPLAQVSAIRNADEEKAYEKLQHPNWLQLWAGYFDLGYALARGNSRADTLTTTFTATRTTRTDQTTLSFDQLYATGLVNGVSGTTADSVRGGITYNRNVNKKLFINLFNNYTYDRFQDLNLRFVLGGGLGYYLIKNDSTQFSLVGGANYNHENFSTPLIRNSAELYFGDDLAHKMNAHLLVNQSFRMYNNMTDLGNYRFNFTAGISATIWKWMAFHLTGVDSYLSNPAPGRLKNDLVLSTGLRATFAH